MPLADVAAAVWYGDGAMSRATRTLLMPASVLFGAGVSWRNARFDARPAIAGPIPALSIGNLSVGGTGKTPVSAWFARRLLAAGAHPALVLRGYGEDELAVHRLLNPAVPVLAGADRAVQVARAAAQGADVAVLDDAFQHRRAARVADVVLVSADRWSGGPVRVLPAGPFREPLHALRRASLVLVTAKAASDAQIAAAVAAVRAATDAPAQVVDLVPASFVRVPDGTVADTASWRGRRVLALSGIGDPRAFQRQLRHLGLVTEPMAFPDHHAYDAATVRAIAARAIGMDAVICTLKDAVKLGLQWPSSAVPLWYLSQTVVPRDGADVLDDVVQSVLAARRGTVPIPNP